MQATSGCRVFSSQKVYAASKAKLAKFLSVTDWDWEHIAQGQQLLRTESLYWARVKDAILLRSSRIHDTLN